MKRLICALISLLLLCGTLTGCHGSKKQSTFEIPAEFDSSKQYELTFWAKNDTNLTQVEIYKKAVADFEALYPNVKINLRLYTDYGRIYNDVITNIATGTTPNVCITYPDHIATYLTGENTVVPLDGLMADEKFGLGGSEVRFESPKKNEIIAKYLEEGEIGGVQYAIPFLRSTEACYVNKTFVEKLGFTLPETLTWDFIWEVCAKAVEKDAEGNYIVNGQKTLIPCIYKSTDNMMIQVLRQQGAKYSTAEGEIGLFNDTAKEFLLEIAEHTKNGEFSTFKISSYPANFLNAGQCIFAIDSTAGATWMGSDAPLVDIPEDKLVKFETAVMTVPQFDTENPTMISQGPSVCIFDKEDDGEVLASWLFVQYLLTNEVQIAYSQTEGYVPVTSAAQNAPEYLDYLAREGEDNELYYDVKLKATKLALEYTDKTFVTPVFNGSASLRNAAGQLIEEVAKGARRNKTIDDAFIENLYGEMTSLYRLDGIGGGQSGRAELGELPSTAVLLLSAIGAAWVFIAAYLLIGYFQKRKNQGNT